MTKETKKIRDLRIYFSSLPNCKVNVNKIPTIHKTVKYRVWVHSIDFAFSIDIKRVNSKNYYLILDYSNPSFFAHVFIPMCSPSVLGKHLSENQYKSIKWAFQLPLSRTASKFPPVAKNV